MDQKFKPQLEWNLPLSGATTVTMPSFAGAQFGLFNIDLGGSSDPALERKLIDAAGSYGKQLGKICEVISVMLAHMESGKPIDPKDKSVIAFKSMAKVIDAAKGYHQSK